MLLNRMKRKAMSMSQGSRRETKRMKSKMRIQPQGGHQGAEGAAKIPLKNRFV
jgi:hypothetical protein